MLIFSGFAGALDPALRVGDVVRGREIVTVDEVVASAKEKAELFARTGMRAVDMESEHLAAVARELEIPFCVARVISDDAHHDLPVPAGVLDHAARAPVVGGMRLVAWLAIRPWRWAGFRRFLRDSNRAQRAIGDLAGQLDSLAQEATSTRRSP